MSVVERPFVVENEIGLPIRCDIRLPEGEGPFPVVVILHGFKGFKDWGMFPPTARRLAQSGIATVAMNASMNGVEDRLEEFTNPERFARNTPHREILDVRRVVDAVTSGEADPSLDGSRLGLLGHSRGGAIVLLAAAGNPRVKCVVTWASVASFLRYTGRAREEWRRAGRLEVPNLRTGQILWLDREVLDDLEARGEEYDLEAACRRMRLPFLAIHGEQDEAVAVDDSRELVGWAGSEEKRLCVLPKTGHTFGAAHPWNGGSPAWERAVDETAGWFTKHLGAGPGGADRTGDPLTPPAPDPAPRS